MSSAISAARSLFRFWPLLLPLALLLPGINAFPFPASGALYSDLAISHYPNAVFLRRALLSDQAPLWSPAVLSGYPFAANPLSGLWYPPGWLALALPLPLGFNILVMLHLLLGGVGMYRLLRLEGLGQSAALFGGLAFEAMPKLFAHYGAGHLTLLYAVPWTPWLLASIAGKRPAGWRPAALLALIFLADVRWAAFAGLLWLAYGLWRSPGLRPVSFRPLTVRWRDGAYLAGQGLLAGLLAAPLALPLLEYTRLSTRAHLGAEDVLLHSLPPARLLGLLFPDFGGFHEYTLYAGGVVLLLSLLALSWKVVRRRAGFWGWTAVLSLAFALGEALPLLPAVAGLPGLSLLRVPSRALFLTGLSLAALAGHAVEHLLAGPTVQEKRRAGLAITGLAGFALALAGGAAWLSGALPASYAWGAALLTAGAVLIALRLNGRMAGGPWLWVLLLAASLDWGAVDRAAVAWRPAGETQAEGQAVAAFLARQPGTFRVYSPSYSLPQQTAADYGLELADGVDPLQLKTYADFMESASGVRSHGYSVTLPPFENGEPQSDNAAARPDPALLGLLNVRYVLAEYDLPVDGLTLIRRFGNTRVYENEQALPRAWLQPPGTALGEEVEPVEFMSRHIGGIYVAARGPGDLVLSEIAYPGWQVRVDGQPADMQAAGGLLRSVTLKEGAHFVAFIYRPMSLYAGLALSALALLLFAGRALLSMRRQR